MISGNNISVEKKKQANGGKMKKKKKGRKEGKKQLGFSYYSVQEVIS